MRSLKSAVCAASMALMLCVSAGQAAPLSSTFTYQGFVEVGGAPLTGTADLRFSLWNAAVGGVQIGAAVTNAGVTVTDGQFTVPVDFGVAAFNGDMRWIQIEVRSPAGGGAYTMLTPRTPVTVTPYALQTRGMFVDASLNAGIGTTSPSARLDVAQGDLVVSSGGVPQIRLDMNDPGNFASGPDLDMYNAGLLGLELTTVPEGHLGRSFNTTTSALVSAFGTSNLGDGSGFINVRSRDFGTTMVQLWADADAVDNGISQGQIRVRSQGGGMGGEIQVWNDDGLQTFGLLGGQSGNPATVTLFNPGSGADGILLNGEVNGFGGGMYSYSEDGFYQCILEPDVNGQGLFVQWARTDGNGGMTYDGNYAGSGNPSWSIIGASRSAQFNMNFSGNSSVSLPTDAVSAVEMFDEPGVASEHLLGPIAGAGLSIITSRSITVPASGYVLVLATCESSRSHSNGSTSSSYYGVSDSSASLPNDQDFDWVIAPGAPSGSYDNCISVHGLFDVAAAGTYTYYFLINNNSVAGSYTINDVQFTVVYFPTAYGTVDPTLEFTRGLSDENSPRPGPLTPRDIANEQAQAAQFDQMRVATELAQMRAQMAALQAQLDAVERAQAAVREQAPKPAQSKQDPGGN